MSESLDAIKNRILIFLEKIQNTVFDELWDIFVDLLDDVAKVIGGEHIKTTEPPSLLY